MRACRVGDLAYIYHAATNMGRGFSRSLEKLCLAAAVSSAVSAASLDVAYNNTDGNATVTFGGHRVVGGVPVFAGLSLESCAYQPDEESAA